MENRVKNSFSAAGIFPAKLLKDGMFVDEISKNKRIIPRHLQVIPTNKCNLSCRFCSCADEDRKLECNYNDLISLLSRFRSLGSNAITITGGGEPAMYKDINRLIFALSSNGLGYKLGMATNGTLLYKMAQSVRHMSWIRISLSDASDFNKIFNNVRDASLVKGKCDLAFSYVAEHGSDPEKIKEAIKFAIQNKMSHVRIVADIHNPNDVDMNYLKEKTGDIGSWENAIWQPRSEYEHGMDCRICYLKPVISPDGNVYACCGAQYALGQNKTRKMPEQLSLGKWDEALEKLSGMTATDPFDGSICKVCYYGDYNRALELMSDDLEHVEFV